MENNINRKERLERRSSISLSFKLDLQLFANKETPSGGPNLPDHKASDPFLDNMDFTHVVSNPYTIKKVDKRFKARATYLINIRYESLDDWFKIQGVRMPSGTPTWPDQAEFVASSTSGRVLDTEDQARVKNYFASKVYATSANRFSMENDTTGTLMNDDSIHNIVKNIDFGRCTSAVKMFYNARSAKNVVFENNTFVSSNLINMEEAFAGSPTLTTFTFKTGGTLAIRNAIRLFANCPSLRTVDISEVKINPNTLIHTFKNCSNLEEVKGTIDISNLNFNPNYINNKAFIGCSKINKPVTIYSNSPSFFNTASFIMRIPNNSEENLKKIIAAYFGLDVSKVNLIIDFDIL